MRPRLREARRFCAAASAAGVVGEFCVGLFSAMIVSSVAVGMPRLAAEDGFVADCGLSSKKHATSQGWHKKC